MSFLYLACILVSQRTLFLIWASEPFIHSKKVWMSDGQTPLEKPYFDLKKMWPLAPSSTYAHAPFEKNQLSLHIDFLHDEILIIND